MSDRTYLLRTRQVVYYGPISTTYQTRGGEKVDVIYPKFNLLLLIASICLYISIDVSSVVYGIRGFRSCQPSATTPMPLTTESPSSDDFAETITKAASICNLIFGVCGFFILAITISNCLRDGSDWQSSANRFFMRIFVPCQVLLFIAFNIYAFFASESQRNHDNSCKKDLHLYTFWMVCAFYICVASWIAMQILYFTIRWFVTLIFDVITFTCAICVCCTTINEE